MKHGYTVVGKESWGEFMSGKHDTKRAVLKTYRFMMDSKQYSDACKKTLKIVELVEKDITAELTA